MIFLWTKWARNAIINQQMKSTQLIILQKMSENKEKQVELASEHNNLFPFTVEDIKIGVSMSVPILQVQAHRFEKIVQEDYWIYRKTDWQQQGLLKTVLQLPGTAFVNFNVVNADAFYPFWLQLLSSDTQIIIAFSPNAPQHKFPTPVLHLQRTISHLLEQADHYRIDKANISFGGYSSGGTLVIPLVIYFAKRNITFKSILILSPIFDYSDTLRNNQELIKKWEDLEKMDGKYLNWGFIEFMNKHYSNSKEDLIHPWYSPLFTPIEDLKSLGKICLAYGEHDFMRRSIEAFKNRLAGAEVSCETILLEQEGHLCFIMSQLNTVLEPAVRQAIKAKKESNIHVLAKHINHVLQ